MLRDFPIEGRCLKLNDIIVICTVVSIKNRQAPTRYQLWKIYRLTDKFAFEYRFVQS